jgi:hypothetical protein
VSALFFQYLFPELYCAEVRILTAFVFFMALGSLSLVTVLFCVKNLVLTKSEVFRSSGDCAAQSFVYSLPLLGRRPVSFLRASCRVLFLSCQSNHVQ